MLPKAEDARPRRLCDRRPPRVAGPYLRNDSRDRLPPRRIEGDVGLPRRKESATTALSDDDSGDT